MLKLLINEDKQPEFEAEYPEVSEVEDYAKAFGQSLVELINGTTVNVEEATNDQRRKAVMKLLKDAKQIAYFKMQSLGWLGETMTLDELLDLDDVIADEEGTKDN